MKNIHESILKVEISAKTRLRTSNARPWFYKEIRTLWSIWNTPNTSSETSRTQGKSRLAYSTHEQNYLGLYAKVKNFCQFKALWLQKGFTFWLESFLVKVFLFGLSFACHRLSRLHIFPGGKHNLHLKYKDDFNRLVEDFLLE